MPDNLRRVGVTGTRQGATDAQITRARTLLAAISIWSTHRPDLHFGDCVGVDAEIYEIATMLGYWTVAHPPSVGRYRARKPADEVRSPKDYLVRNDEIVEETDILLAFPKEHAESKFGGTWHTVRYARQRGRHLVIVWPDGTETP